MLNTGKDFVIIDFEGEPRRALGERVLKRSPLLDVAGMLRSFDYAARWRRAGGLPEADIARLEPWARGWVRFSLRPLPAKLFRHCSRRDLPAEEHEDIRLLLEAFLLDKAVYEIGYEISYRPDFLSIPVNAVLRLLDTESGSGIGEF